MSSRRVHTAPCASRLTCQASAVFLRNWEMQEDRMNEYTGVSTLHGDNGGVFKRAFRTRTPGCFAGAQRPRVAPPQRKALWGPLKLPPEPQAHAPRTRI